jgi:hypothetical protein
MSPRKSEPERKRLAKWLRVRLERWLLIKDSDVSENMAREILKAPALRIPQLPKRDREDLELGRLVREMPVGALHHLGRSWVVEWLGSSRSLLYFSPEDALRSGFKPRRKKP